MKSELIKDFLQKCKDYPVNEYVKGDISRDVNNFIYDNDFSREELREIYRNISDVSVNKRLSAGIVRNILSCQVLGLEDAFTKDMIHYLNSLEDILTSPNNSIILGSNFRCETTKAIVLDLIERSEFTNNSDGIFVWIFPVMCDIVSDSSRRIKIFSLKTIREHLSTFGYGGPKSTECVFIPYESILNVRFHPFIDTSMGRINGYTGDLIYRTVNGVRKMNNSVWRNLNHD